MLKPLPLLILVPFLLGVTMPSHTGVSSEERRGADPATPADPCCDRGAAANHEAPTNPEDCCKDDCRGCPLPCCAGTLAVATASVAGLVELAAASSVIPPPPARPHGEDLHDIDHPPRI